MSYYRELKDFILELRGSGFFLSPRDRWFLKFLEEEGYPVSIVKEGIRKFFLFYPPERRAKLPLFMSFGEIEKLKRHHTERVTSRKDWRERFKEKVNMAETVLGQELEKPNPRNVEEAEEFLQSLESLIAKRLWESLSKEEKAQIVSKFKVFKEREDLFKAMVKRELFKRAGLKSLSIFLE